MNGLCNTMRLLGVAAVLVLVNLNLLHSQSWAIAGTLQVPRYSLQTVVLPDGRILVLGGVTGSTHFMDGTSLNGQSTDVCEAFDPLTGNVEVVAPMKTPRSEFPALVAPDGKVYVFGGLAGESQTGPCTADIEMYDPATNEWTVVGAMTTNRRRHSAVMIDENRVLICGGCSTDRVTRGESEIFDLSTYTTVPTGPMPENMKEGKLAIIDGGIPCYIGGRSGGGNSPRQSSTFLFDIQNLLWYTAPQPEGMPGVVSGTVVGESVVICGGNLTEFPFQFARGVYSVQNSVADHVYDMAQGRSFHTMVPIGGRTVLVSGGMRENYGTLASTIALDVEGKLEIIKPEHVISRAYHELLRYEHPVLGLTFYAFSGVNNVRSDTTSNPRGGDDGLNNPLLTPTIEVLTVASEEQLLASTGVNDLIDNPVRVYPNPSVDVITVSATQGAVVSIIDVKGHTIASGNVSGSSITFNIGDVPTGAYLVVVNVGSERTYKPIIKH